MEERMNSQSKKNMSLIISQIIIVSFLLLNLYVFLTQESTFARVLVMLSTIGFLFLLIGSMKLKRKN
ncbi:hypothetical protein [Halalkalibacillus halophilus]|uniref:hypothetical protein n=1 Tax=Halalkalibacillus halophilus TaxID=392827 RepID=UPI00047FEA4A|nr:hypothetical protein [Halalkalibacillus halophilus]